MHAMAASNTALLGRRMNVERRTNVELRFQELHLTPHFTVSVVVSHHMAFSD